MKTLLAVAVALLFAGCSSPSGSSSDTVGVSPSLTQIERDEISAAVAKRKDYVLFAISELKAGGLEVTLTRQENSNKGMILRFKRSEGHWVEDPTKAEEVDFLIP